MIETTRITEAMPLRERALQVLKYPARPGPLSTIAALAASHMVLGLLPSPIGFFLDLFVWAALFKYSFEVVRWSANGRVEAPEISFTVGDTVGGYAVFLLLATEIVLSLIGSWYGWLAAMCVGIAMMTALPAMVIILALEEGMLRALNPLAWVQLGVRLGRHYLVLIGFFCAALVVQSAIAAALGYVVPEFLATFAVACVVNYLLIANFHLIGVVIYDRRDELGYTGHLELQDETPAGDLAGPVIAAARNRAATGDAQGAATLLRDEMQAQPDTISLHVEYRHWLRQCANKTELAAHGKQFIAVLLKQDQDARAIDIARESQQLDSTFALDRPEDITRLARAAAEAGQTQVALGLIAGFHKRFRSHADVARNYLLAAKLLAERMNKEMPARALLRQIKLEFPHDPAIAEVDAYLAFLDRLAATKVPRAPAP